MCRTQSPWGRSAHPPAATRHRVCRKTDPITLIRGAGSNCKNLAVEPPDHGIGRSRGGLTSKIHQWSTARDVRWWSWCSPTTGRCSSICWPICAWHGPGVGGRVPAPIGCAQTRPTPAAPTALRYGAAGSPRSFPNRQIRSATANDAVPGEADHHDSTPETTRAATSSNEISTSSNKAGHPLRQTGHRLPRSRRPPSHHHLARPFIRHA